MGRGGVDEGGLLRKAVITRDTGTVTVNHHHTPSLPSFFCVHARSVLVILECNHCKYVSY